MPPPESPVAVAGQNTGTAPTPDKPQVSWVMHPSYQAFMQAYKASPTARKLNPRERLGAFVTYSGLLSEGGECQVHTLSPDAYGSYQQFQDRFNHELEHCEVGQFHKDDGTLRHMDR